MSGASRSYWARLGSRSETCCIISDSVPLERGHRIVCRTDRGLEIGSVLCERESDLSASYAGKWIRNARAEDELLWQNLVALSSEAAAACQAFLRNQGRHDVLLDVEPLLDGRTLYFHFLGEPSEELGEQLAELANVYQNSVRQSRFAQQLEQGCGPECGTGARCGSDAQGGCTVCVVAGRCSAKD